MTFIVAGVSPPDVILTSNLYQGATAYEAQMVTFRCTIRGIHEISLSWSSLNYIGAYILEFYPFDRPQNRTSPVNPTTIATLIRANTDSGTGVTEVVSELHIEASLQYPSSIISCQNGWDRTRRSITFSKPEKLNNIILTL